MKDYKIKSTIGILVFVLLIFHLLPICAQKKDSKDNFINTFLKNTFDRDTILIDSENIETADTVISEMPDIYKQVKENNNSGVGKKIYDLIVREPSYSEELIEKSDNDLYKGKIIEQIEIIVLDPFGTNVDNPLVAPSGIEKRANNIHVRTKESIVRNNLQFKKGDVVDPVMISETEAYLRKLGYFNDVRIRIQEIELIDRVIAQVVVRDVWSLGLEISDLSSSSFDVSIFDKNILGYGNRVEADFICNKDYSLQQGYGAGYLHKNLMHSFVDLQGSYLDDIGSRKIYFLAERPLQPAFNYFGQISFSSQIGRPEVVGWDSISPDRLRIFSVTFGRAFTLPAQDAVKRLVFAGRYFEKTPEYRNVSLPESIVLPYDYVKKRSFLFQVSLYKQAYNREHLIHGFGATEDIACGYNLSIQFGYTRFPQYESGIYSSFSASAGTNTKVGNFYAATAVSSFFNDNGPFEGVLKFDWHYFSPLKRIGKNRFRHFVNIDYSKLLNPVGLFDNSVYFSQLTNLYTWNSRYDAAGMERLVLNMESDMFTPLNIAGFRFLFYTFFDLAWIGNKKLFVNDNLYGGIGLGVRIRNDLLVFKTIELKVGYYPRFDQSGFNDFFDIDTSYPKVSPNFVPGYPDEISLN